MKKLMFGAGVAATLALTACTNEAPELNGASGEGVTFTVNLPKEIGTRAAFGDGLQADMLYYAVYDDKGNYVLDSSKSFGGAISTTVSIPLANGMTYSVAFFACETAEGNDAPYTFDAQAGTFTANYANMAKDYNAKDHDAFFKLETIEVSGAQSRTVTLTRPVAQINWGTNDLDAAAVVAESAYGADAANLTSKVTAKAVHTTFNMKAGQVTDDLQDVVLFEAMARPGKIDGGVTPVDFAVEGYDLVSTQYLLVPTTSSVVDLEWTPLCSGVEKPSAIVTGAPVQANFRTNIYGALLSAPQEFEVIKDNVWGDPDNNIEWGGIQVDQDGNYTITSPEGLVSLSNLVNSGEEDFKGKNVKLLNDLDMQGVAFNPIGFYRQTTTRAIVTSHQTFKGTFDGGNHTISNLTVIDETQGFGEAALFGSFSEGTIKNLTVKNITAKSHHYAAGLVAHFIGQNLVGVIENCHVDGATIVSTPEMVNGAYDNGDKAGGLVGYIQKENNASAIRNCSVKNSTVIAYRDLGGLIGCVSSKNNTLEISGNSVSDTKVLQSEENAYKTSPITTVAEVIGRFDLNAETLLSGKIGCTTSNVTTSTGVIAIGSAEQLVALAAQQNTAGNHEMFLGKQIILTADIDMKGYDFTPFGNAVNAYPSTAFRGKFDGQGHKISNLTISQTGNWATAALFGCVKGETNNPTIIENLVIENPNYTSTHYAGAIAGYTSDGNGVTIRNCKVIGGSLVSTPELLGSEWDNGDKVGGIMGYANNSTAIEGCEVTGTKIQGYRHLGSIIGYIETGFETTVKNNKATDTQILWDNSQDYKNFGDIEPSFTLPNLIFGKIAGNKGEALGTNSANNVTVAKAN